MLIPTATLLISVWSPSVSPLFIPRGSQQLLTQQLLHDLPLPDALQGTTVLFNGDHQRILRGHERMICDGLDHVLRFQKRRGVAGGRSVRMNGSEAMRAKINQEAASEKPIVHSLPWAFTSS